jgi:hypothetical protein
VFTNIYTQAWHPAGAPIQLTAETDITINPAKLFDDISAYESTILSILQYTPITVNLLKLGQQANVLFKLKQLADVNNDFQVNSSLCDLQSSTY